MSEQRTVQSGFVARDERERLLAVFADLVAARGLARVTLDDLAAEAEVALEVVRRYFDTVEDCALEAVHASSQQCFSAAAQAFMSSPGDCPLAARAALDAMLRYMAAAPAFAHLAVVEFPRLGERARRQRQREMDLFAEFLGPGFAAAQDLPPSPELISQLIAGGIYAILQRHYHDGRLEQLPEALPAITYLTVVTFFGPDEARRVCGRPHRE